MPILGERIYRGTIHRAKLEKKEKQDGGVTTFLKVRVQVPGEGFIDTELYFTPNAIQQTKKVLGELNSEIWEGTYPYLLRDPEQFLKGRDCRIETENHVFVNKSGIEERSVRVKWLNGIISGKPAGESEVLNVLALLGVQDTYVAVAAEPLESTTTSICADDDTPF